MTAASKSAPVEVALQGLLTSRTPCPSREADVFREETGSAPGDRGGVGVHVAADKATFQQVRVLSCQLPDSDT